MTTLFDHRGRAGRASALCLLALAAALLGAREARAQWTQPDASGHVTNTNTGGVGIGGAPVKGSKLEVRADYGVAAGEHGLIYASRAGVGTGGVFFGYRANGTAATGGYMRSISNLPLFVGTTATPEALTISDNGNFGIGTNTPGSKFVLSSNAASPLAYNPANLYSPQDGTILHIVNADTQKTRVTIDSFGSTAGPSISFRAGRGTLAAPAATQVGDALGIVYGGGFGATRFHSAAKPGMWMVANENWTDTAAGSDIFFNTVPNGTLTPVERMRINGAGNIGIGTATPGVVNGMTANAPYMPLHIQGQGANPASVVVNSASPFSGYVINDSSQPVDSRMWSISQAAGGGRLTFRTYSDSGSVSSDKVVIDRSGNVGVGVANPTSKLHVVGDITVTGNINAKYQDVAEYVPSTQKLAAGTVVVLDTGHDNHVLASKGAYDTRVAGVISAQPGISLGERGEGKVLVATTGRVKVKVDATREPIRIGDLIVTSDVEGVAMKSVPVELGGVAIHRPGTLIGKALESLEKGTGEILVLLSLQ